MKPSISKYNFISAPNQFEFINNPLKLNSDKISSGLKI